MYAIRSHYASSELLLLAWHQKNGVYGSRAKFVTDSATRADVGHHSRQVVFDAECAFDRAAFVADGTELFLIRQAVPTLHNCFEGFGSCIPVFTVDSNRSIYSWRLDGDPVITSYSRHYTKVYEY